MKILIMGLPGSGKTTLAKNLSNKLTQYEFEHEWFNADNVRSMFEDWDFSYEGRIRHAGRMGYLADKAKIAICDFVCPTHETLELFEKDKKADFIVWMDTIKSGRFEDTNKMFQQPSRYDLRIKSFNDDWASVIYDMLMNGKEFDAWDDQAPTVQMLGRWQPWHEGHQKLFERALSKTGQVCIMIRDCQGWNDSNPFDVHQVEANIHKALEPNYYGRYKIMTVPNIVNITYGRDVGYKIEQEVLDPSVEQISATKIRQQMGLK